jgi:alpha-tubulin suppressor-like RCC1 family protein/plastocyanin
MSRAVRHNLLTFFLLTLTVVLFWYSGCSTGYDNNNSAVPGEFKVRIKLPPPRSGTGSRVIPSGTTHIKIEITGDVTYSQSPIYIDLASPGSGESYNSETRIATKTLTDIPVGLHVATIKAIEKDGAAETTLAQAKHGFYMPPGGIAEPQNIYPGIAIEDAKASPPTITIFEGETLYFQNWDSSQHTVEIVGEPGGSFNVPAAQPQSQPNTPASYSAGSYTFNTPGTYDFKIGESTGDGTTTYEIEVVGSEAGVTGTVFGRITAGVSTVPVANVTVSIGSISTTTDSNGDYTLNDVPSGTLTAVLAGYATYTAAIEVNEVVPVEKDIQLGISMAISGGYFHTIVNSNEGAMWVWTGNNSDSAMGQIGIASAGTTSITPVHVFGPGHERFFDDVIQISAGIGFNVALKSDGTVWTWGVCTTGQLGDGGRHNRWAPVQVKGPGGEGYLTGIIQVDATNAHHVLALKEDGTVFAWGRNNNGSINGGACHGTLGDGTIIDRVFPVQVLKPDEAEYPDPEYLVNIKAVAAGRYNSLALTEGGEVYVWGTNEWGNLSQGSVNNTYSAIPIKVKTGAATYLSDVAAISAGCLFNLVLKNDGSVWAWGSSEHKRLGQSWASSRSYPVLVPGTAAGGAMNSPVDVKAMFEHALLLTASGEVWAWGNNGYGQIGNNKTSTGEDPTKVTGFGGTGQPKIVAITSGSIFNSAAIASNGDVWAWGYNAFGQVGDGTTGNNRLVPVQVLGGQQGITNLNMVEPGGQGNVTGTISIKFSNDTATTPLVGAEVRIGDFDPITTGAGGAFTISDIDSGFYPVNVTGYRSCGLAVWVRGGQTVTRDFVLTVYTQVSAGNNHTLALDKNGNVWSWGSNTSGQLGNTDSGTSDPQLTPVRVMTGEQNASGNYLENIIAVSAGNNFSLALDSRGNVWSWGCNLYGQLGNDGDTGIGEQENLPVAVRYESEGNILILTGVNMISAGGSHSLAIHFTGSTVWAWGSNEYGQLGNGGVMGVNELSNVGVKVSTSVTSNNNSGTTLENITSIAAGGYHSLAVYKDTGSGGRVAAWGRGNDGQLAQMKREGTGGSAVTVIDDENKNTPHEVYTQWHNTGNSRHELSTANEVSAGYRHSLARVGAAVRSWGRNEPHILGHTGTHYFAATSVSAISTITAISAGKDFSLARSSSSSGIIWAWGYNQEGQLGNDRVLGTETSSSPINVKDSTNSANLSGIGNQISAGGAHSIAVTSDGKIIWSWGRNAEGQLGDGSTDERNLPVEVSF